MVQIDLEIIQIVSPCNYAQNYNILWKLESHEKSLKYVYIIFKKNWHNIQYWIYMFIICIYFFIKQNTIFVPHNKLLTSVNLQ